MLLVRLEDFVKFAEFLFQVAGIDRVEPFEETHHFELHLLHVVHLYEEYVHRADLVVDVVVDSRFVGTDQVEDARIALQVAADLRITRADDPFEVLHARAVVAVAEVEAGDLVVKHHAVVQVQLIRIVADKLFDFGNNLDSVAEESFAEIVVDPVGVEDLQGDHAGVVADVPDLPDLLFESPERGDEPFVAAQQEKAVQQARIAPQVGIVHQLLHVRVFVEQADPPADIFIAQQQVVQNVVVPGIGLVEEKTLGE